MLRLRALSSEENQSWEKRLNRHYRECGCGSGRAVLMLALIWGGLYIGLRAMIGAPVGTMEQGIFVGVIAGAALMATIVTRMRARTGLAQTVHELEEMAMHRG
jgi:hypothetical protein